MSISKLFTRSLLSLLSQVGVPASFEVYKAKLPDMISEGQKFIDDQDPGKYTLSVKEIPKPSSSEDTVWVKMVLQKIRTASRQLVAYSFAGEGWYAYDPQTHKLVDGPYKSKAKASYGAGPDDELVYIDASGNHVDPPMTPKTAGRKLTVNTILDWLQESKAAVAQHGGQLEWFDDHSKAGYYFDITVSSDNQSILDPMLDKIAKVSNVIVDEWEQTGAGMSKTTIHLGGRKSSRKANMGKDYGAFVNQVLKNPQGKMQNKVNRLQTRYKGNMDEIGRWVLIELGGELNRLSTSMNSTSAAINSVAKTYAMEPKMITRLFYDVGAPFQYSGAEFDMIKVKESKAVHLRNELETLRATGQDWSQAQKQLLQSLGTMRINPKDKRTLQQGLQEAPTFDAAEDAMYQMELAHQGMRTTPKMMVSYTIPWNQKEAVKRVQLANRRSASLKVKADFTGLKVTADAASLIRVGLTIPAPSKHVRFARNNAETVSSAFHQHLSGKVTADIHVLLPPEEAKRYASSLVMDGGVYAATVWDISGTPHMVKDK